MSLEIPGSDESIENLAHEAGYMAGRAMYATGVPEMYAFTHGNRAGTYAGTYLLVALQQEGLLSVSDLDAESLKEHLRRLDRAAGVASKIGPPIIVKFEAVGLAGYDETSQ